MTKEQTDRDEREALKYFDEWFAQNYPGPNTNIRDPHWHAPSIFTAVLWALDRARRVFEPQGREFWIDDVSMRKCGPWSEAKDLDWPDIDKVIHVREVAQPASESDKECDEAILRHKDRVAVSHAKADARSSPDEAFEDAITKEARERGHDVQFDEGARWGRDYGRRESAAEIESLKKMAFHWQTAAMEQTALREEKSQK